MTPGLVLVRFGLLGLLASLALASPYNYIQELDAVRRIPSSQHEQFMKVKRRRRNFEKDASCPSFEPFLCPNESKCISIQYLCDGAEDCATGYDEDTLLCTAARRPPVEETSSFLQSLLDSHGSNFLEVFFGPKAKNNLKNLGGIQNVAIVLSESHTVEDFARSLALTSADLHNLKLIFMGVEQGDLGILSAIGVKDSELGDMKFFIEKFIKTGFLDI